MTRAALALALAAWLLTLYLLHETRQEVLERMVQECDCKRVCGAYAAAPGGQL